MNNSKKIFLLILSFCFAINAFSQKLYKDKKIDSSFLNYAERPREIAFAHLNKSTFIVGEDIGFTTYIINNTTKKPSQFTSNLYCVIKDKNEKIIKKKLIKVKNGIASNVFSVDSLFTSGNYKFFAYTNWMKNFKEQNFFTATINVIDPKVEKVIKNKHISNRIDAQFLPESGHLLSNVKNTVGVVLKNELGFGVKDAKGNILDEKNKIITSFKVNSLGIGKFSFIPNAGEKYVAKIFVNNISYSFDINKSDVKGIIFSSEKLPVGVNISIKTNNFTIEEIRNKPYKLIQHNAVKLNTYNLSFNKNNTINQFINPGKLFPGINVFTLFDIDNNPIAERLFFNYEGIHFPKVENISVKKTQDSLQFNLSFHKIVSSKLNNISVSLLPKETKSYRHHHNIASSFLLKPYLKEAIERANYYFSNITIKTKEDLDNLLLTQGWSSYNWYNIFNSNLKTDFFIEDGISVKAKVKNTKKSKYVIHPVGKGKPNYYVLEKEDSEFLAMNLFPTQNQTLRLSYLDEKGNLKGVRAYVKFIPSIFPELNSNHSVLKPRSDFYMNSSKETNISLLSLNKTQELDEVIIKSKIKETKIEAVKRRTFGKVHLFTNIDRNKGISFANFIRDRGYGVIENYKPNDNEIANGEVHTMAIFKRNLTNTIYGGSTPTIYLNGNQVVEHGMLADLDMSTVEYIDINKNGVGEGIRGGAGGVIKIRTNNSLQYTKKELKSFIKFNFPVVFSETKKYYIPKYKTYNNSFFKEYGVIDWSPINTLNKNGEVSFKIEKIRNKTIKLYIEGITNDGLYISDVKTIILE